MSTKRHSIQSSTEPALIDQHRHDLVLMRTMISELIVRLNIMLSQPIIVDGKELSEEWIYIWGEKENAVSILTKLTGLLVKIIPMEQDLAGEHYRPRAKKTGRNTISAEDHAIVERFVELEMERRIQGSDDNN